jgi:tetratricopeptide (TPR) repeat protein
MNRKSPALAMALLLPLVAACSAPMGSLNRGIDLLRDHRYDAALPVLDQAVGERPADPASWNNRGIARAHTGQLAEALADYTKAIELSPRDPDIYLNRGNAYLALASYGEAIQDYTRAVQLAPGSGRAYFNRGTARLRAGDRAGAEADWRQAIASEHDPWAQAAMVRAIGIDPTSTTVVAAMPAGRMTPASSATASGMSTPAGPASSRVTLAAPPASANEPAASIPLDARSLAMRAIGREIDGDHGGAVADLRTALGAASDPAQRSRIERVLQALGGSQ